MPEQRLFYVNLMLNGESGMQRAKHQGHNMKNVKSNCGHQAVLEAVLQFKDVACRSKVLIHLGHTSAVNPSPRDNGEEGVNLSS